MTATSNVFSPKSVAENQADTKMSFKDSFPFPGVIVVMGKRGSGKTATAMWVMEQYHKKNPKIGGVVHKAPSAMKKLLPNWVQTTRNIKHIPHNSVVIIDEAQQSANARRSSSNDNLDLANLVALSRQCNQLIILISHHSRKLDMVDIMDASRIIWKCPTVGQIMFERKELQPFCQRAVMKFQGLKGNKLKSAYVMDFENLRFGFTPAKMPDFWNNGISTGMADMANINGSGTLL